MIAAVAGRRLAFETSAGDGSTPLLPAARKEKEREKTHMAQWRARRRRGDRRWLDVCSEEAEEEECHKKVTARMRIH